MTARPGEVDFVSAREQIERGIDSGSPQAEVPALSFEKGDTRFYFHPPSLNKPQIYDALEAIKKHIENVRIHTFEPGYVVFQSIEISAIRPGGTKFKFMSMGAQASVEVTAKGNFTQEEIQACIALFRVFVSDSKSTDPVSILRELGAEVHGGPGLPIEQTSQDPWTWIAGYEQTKNEVQESIVLPLQNAQMFRDVARLSRGSEQGVMPRAILFEGPPGVGKTTVARIIAAVTGIPLIYVPIENILSKYYGESSQNLARIFDAASQFERGILFLDEIDALAGSRDEGLFEATRRVFSVLLRKIDGFDSRDGLLTLGATNRAQDLDHALLSRFDHTIRFPLPNREEIRSIFRSYAHHLKSDELIDLATICEGFSGRNIRDICEYAERRQSRLLLAAGGQAAPPPVNVYADVARNRQANQPA